MVRLYHQLWDFIKRRGRAKPIGARLNAASRAALEQEIRVLREMHGVRVESLSFGETPCEPHAVNPEVEAALKARAGSVEPSASLPPAPCH